MGIVIGVLVLLSAFFSAMETAFSFVNKIRIQQNVESGNKKARSALYVIDHFDKALTAILICNNVVNLGCSSIATVLCMHIFGDIGSAVATGVTTLLVLTFGEVIPKCLAKEHCDAFSVKTAGFLKALTIILSPLVFVFMKLKALALRISGRSEDAPSVTENELKYIVESIEEEGVLEESESEMVRSALDFDETTAEEVLTPRVDVVFINIDDSVVAPVKHHELAIEVIIHVGMLIGGYMILIKVRKSSGTVSDPIYPVELEALRRNLHDKAVAVFIPERTHHAEDL